MAAFYERITELEEPERMFDADHYAEWIVEGTKTVSDAIVAASFGEACDLADVLSERFGRNDLSDEIVEAIA